MEECIYCGAEIDDVTRVPAVDDDDGWAALAPAHQQGCEWIETRAHHYQLYDPADCDAVHVTRITADGEVYGHDAAGCDPVGCAGNEWYYPAVDADTVEVGRTYELDNIGRAIAEIVD